MTDRDDQDEQRPSQLEPEHNFVGALMHLPQSELELLLECVLDDDISDWRARAVVELIRPLAAEGQPIDPVAVSAASRAAARNSETMRRLDHYILDVYRNVMTPTNARYYAHRVVEDAYRRDFAAAGIRLNQMAEAWADIEDLEQFTGELVRRWRETRQRVRAINPAQGEK